MEHFLPPEPKDYELRLRFVADGEFSNNTGFMCNVSLVDDTYYPIMKGECGHTWAPIIRFFCLPQKEELGV